MPMPKSYALIPIAKLKCDDFAKRRKEKSRRRKKRAALKDINVELPSSRNAEYDLHPTIDENGKVTIDKRPFSYSSGQENDILVMPVTEKCKTVTVVDLTGPIDSAGITSDQVINCSVKVLSCPVCLIAFDKITAMEDNFVILSRCGHLFCHKCDENVLQKAGSKKTGCPRCGNCYYKPVIRQHLNFTNEASKCN